MESDDIRKELEKKYPGIFTIYPVKKIRTGIFVLDLLTGGGIPESRITIFWGAKSSCKTTVALKVANQFLKMKPNSKVLYLDFEHSYDETWSKHFIEDLNRLIYVAPNYGEEGIDIMSALCEADDVSLAIVDSVAMMIPQAEAEASSLDDFMCKHPRLVNKMFRKIAPIMAQSRNDGRNLTLLLINQPVYDVGKRSFQPMMKKPGGIRQDMLASLDIRFYPGTYKKVGGVAISITSSFVIEKNKVGIPKGKGEFTLYISPYHNHKIGEIEETKTLLVYAKRAEILTRKGNKWVYNGDTINSLDDINKEELKELLLNKLLTDTSLLMSDEKEEDEE